MAINIDIFREQREKEEFDRHVREEMERQKAELCKDQTRVDQKTEYRKRLVMERLKEMETKDAIDNLKVTMVTEESLNDLRLAMETIDIDWRL
jgi:inhibitor of KinA sporulation pathway (predicted exonuclease)